MQPIDPSNVQGLVFRLYRYPLSRHMFFKVADAAGARSVLRTLLPSVTTAALDLGGYPEPLINVGLTWNGLVAIGAVDPAVRDKFDDDFTGRHASPNTGHWDGRMAAADVHLTLHLHCRNAAALEQATARIRSQASPALQELAPEAGEEPSITGRSLGGDTLHFGFRDGISQPAVNWDDLPDRPDLLDMRHFVLGYYSHTAQSYPSTGPLADLVRDGSYGAFQWIYQDVAGFETFLDQNAPGMAAAAGVANGRELLAAKMMGRWRDGTPLAVSPDHPDPAAVNAQIFGYAADPAGLRCPLTAHVRVANRRDQPLTKLVADNFPDGGPYLQRRGMAYGGALAGSADDGKDRGLVGMFLTADLSHFALVMKWINRTDFSPVFQPDHVAWQDMMMGERNVPGAIAAGSIPLTGQPPLDFPALPQFIRIKGTAFLLLPSLRGLTQIAAATQASGSTH